MSLVTVPSNLFTFSDRKFIIEHSTLVGNYPAAGRTHTIAIKSERTGKVEAFKFEGAIPTKNDDGVYGWVFGYAGNNPELVSLTMVVLND
jgi:hypothetical protein